MSDQPPAEVKLSTLERELLDKKPYGDLTLAFLFKWNASSSRPDSILFPDGLERQIKYMRDGILTFKKDPLAAQYERVLDDQSLTNSIVVYFRMTDVVSSN